jgi:hypothetical protein
MSTNNTSSFSLSISNDNRFLVVSQSSLFFTTLPKSTNATKFINLQKYSRGGASVGLGRLLGLRSSGVSLLPLVAGGPGGKGAAGLGWFEFLYQTYGGGCSTVVGTASHSARAPLESYLYWNHAYYVDIVGHNSTAFADHLRTDWTGSFGSAIIID